MQEIDTFDWFLDPTSGRIMPLDEGMRARLEAHVQNRQLVEIGDYAGGRHLIPAKYVANNGGMDALCVRDLEEHELLYVDLGGMG